MNHKTLLASILLLNTFDAVFTLFIVTAGLGYESNPLMAWVLGYGPVAFMLVKLAGGGACVYVFSTGYPLWIAVYGAYMVARVYALIAAYHIACFAAWVVA